MFKKTVNELSRCKGSRLFVILMSVNYAHSCVMPALNGGFVDFLVTNRDPSRVVWFAAFVASIGISASFMSYAMGVNVSRVILEMTTRLMGATCESFERGPLEKGGAGGFILYNAEGVCGFECGVIVCREQLPDNRA